MDLAFQTECEEDRSARMIGRALAVWTKGATILSWCMEQRRIVRMSWKRHGRLGLFPLAKDLYESEDE